MPGLVRDTSKRPCENCDPGITSEKILPKEGKGDLASSNVIQECKQPKSTVLTGGKQGLWRQALFKFERFRVIHGHSIESLFKFLNPRDTRTLPVREFADNLSQFCREISFQEALALGISCCSEGRRYEIQARDIQNLISREVSNVSLESLLTDHPVFPNWLIQREDFQSHFTEWTSQSGIPSDYLVEIALQLRPEDRRPQDLQVLSKWMRVKNILTHVKHNRLLDLCR